LSAQFTRRVRLLDDAEIIRRYQEIGDSVRVSLEAGIDPTRVLAICRAAGVPIQKPGGRPGRRRLKLTEDEIARRYRDGESGPTLAEAAGCSIRHIYDLLERLGVPRRPATIGLKRGRRRSGSTGSGGNG
jgi:hypothetical protein